jgi:hypothetical protein
MSIADEIRKLQELHQAGALTDTEFAQAKARVLAGQPGATQGEQLRDELAGLRRQQALDRLDREWDHERERYLFTSRYGNRYTPSKGNAVAQAAGLVAFGVLVAFMPALMFGGLGAMNWLFALLGAVAASVGASIALFTYARASQYEHAYKHYQRTRALLLSGGDEGNDLQTPARASQAASTAIQNLSEAETCPRCGRTIPAGVTTCARCGWMRA